MEVQAIAKEVNSRCFDVNFGLDWKDELSDKIPTYYPSKYDNQDKKSDEGAAAKGARIPALHVAEIVADHGG